jgi:hypothetical protein
VMVKGPCTITAATSITPYKHRISVLQHAGTRPRSTRFLHSAVVTLLFAMVSFVYLLKAAIAFAPLVSGHYRHRPNATLPSLAEATIEELAAGLEAKLFTSVDLVDVSRILA